MTDTVRLHNIVFHTRVLGPGDRTAIWFQGCLRRCKGCMSPSSRPMDGGEIVSIPMLCDAVLAQEGIEGVTISGGEPFLQPVALENILTRLRSSSSLGVIIYTGYTIAQLRELGDLHINRILNGLVDLLIDGEYIEALNDGKSLRGSSNQRLIFLTDRYRSCWELYEGTTRNAEVILSAGEAFFIGIPSVETWHQWELALRDLETEERKQK